jgi:hypothetical protein
VKRLAVFSSVVVLLFVVLALALSACGGEASYEGTWVGPSPSPGSQQARISISPANEGWWAVQLGTGPDRSTYVAKVGDELQSENGTVRLKVDGDTLTIVAPAGYPTLTRQ